MKQINSNVRSAIFSLSLTFAVLPTLVSSQAGSLVPTYASGTGANSRITCSAVQSDGKLVIGGTFTAYAGTSRKRIARLTTNGNLDTSFDPGSGASSSVNDVDIQPNGKIIIGGQFSSYNGVLQRSIARLNADGSLDLTFNTGAGFNGIVTAVDVLPSGKILVAGWFTTFDGVSRSRIAQLNSDGSLDMSFNPGAGPDAAVLCLSVAPDGRIYIGGSFATVSGIARSAVARLLSNGSVDPTFVTGTGLNSPCYALTVQPNGSLVVGGPFVDYNGTSRPRIARILPTGALDLTFDPGTGFNSWVYSLSLQTDGKVICGGDFSTFNGNAASRIVRLNSTGTRDVSFTTGTGFNNWVYGTNVLPEGDIIVVGGYGSYNGTARGAVAKLMSGCTEQLELTLETDGNGAQTSWELIPDGYTYPVCSGSGFANNATIQTGCCVPAGSYRLKVMDSAGDGITNGGYVLTNADGVRIIDNKKNFMTGGVSAISGNEVFSTTIGTDEIMFLQRDKLDWVQGQYLVIIPNPAVSAQYGVTNTTSGYEVWFYDPNGTYSFKRFLSHANNDLYGNAELRACHMRLNNWDAADHIPVGILLNIRVRSRVAGVSNEWGPASQFKMDPTAADCPSTRLVWDPTSIHFSCGVTRALNQRVIAQPVRFANKYKFEFVNSDDGYYREIASNNYVRTLNFNGPGLVPGQTYQVRVAVSFDNGANYCPYGPVCEVSIAGAMIAPPPGDPVHVIISGDQALAMNVWPNPSTGSTINFSIDAGSDLGGTMLLKVVDATGRTIQQKTMVVEGSIYYSTLDFSNELSIGTYFLEAQIGEQRSIQRFMVTH